MIAENCSDSNLSGGFDHPGENNTPESETYDGIHMDVTSSSYSKPTLVTNASTSHPLDSSISITKPSTKPKPILKNPRRCSTPDLRIP